MRGACELKHEQKRDVRHGMHGQRSSAIGNAVRLLAGAWSQYFAALAKKCEVAAAFTTWWQNTLECGLRLHLAIVTAQGSD
jgi:hypothetical protein